MTFELYTYRTYTTKTSPPSHLQQSHAFRHSTKLEKTSNDYPTFRTFRTSTATTNGRSPIASPRYMSTGRVCPYLNNAHRRSTNRPNATAISFPRQNTQQVIAGGFPYSDGSKACSHCSIASLSSASRTSCLREAHLSRHNRIILWQDICR
jgi:hypothetical protein